MKVLIVGASGMIGREALIQCLAHPDITRVVAFARKSLPEDVSGHSKLETVIITDFSSWAEDILQKHSDAVGIIWAMGTYNGSMTVDLEYPMAFVKSMGAVVQKQGSRVPFRFVLLSGKFVRQNQEEKLYFMEKPRKIKGLLETRSLAHAENHPKTWKTFVLKPGGVVARKNTDGGFVNMLTGLGSGLGENWSVKIQELGALMAYLVVDGKGEDSLIDNARIVKRGRELWEASTHLSE